MRSANALISPVGQLAGWAVLAVSSVCLAQSEPPAEVASSTPDRPTAVAAAGEAQVKPRFELHVPSVRRLIAEVRRSHTGLFTAHFGNILREMAGASAEGVDAEEAAAIVSQIQGWPDSGAHGVMFAPDTEGRPRWMIRFDWPINDLHARIEALLATKAAKEIFEGVLLESTSTGRYAVRLPEATLAFLLPGGDTQAYLASHEDLEFPALPFAGTAETEAGGASLLVARLNLTGTEADSGATFLSSFSAVTAVDYAGRVNDNGEWIEGVHVYWPTISGMAVKAFLGKVKHTFFVPDEAFGSIAFSTMMGPGMLEGVAGFGPQVMMENPGEIELVGEVEVGPIAQRIRSDVCVTLLPGNGFLPVPDIVVQSRAKRTADFAEDMRAATQKINQIHRGREQPEPWHETTVRDRAVFWSDSSTQYRGMIMPVIARPVIFLTRELDAKEKERDFLVMGWTTTSPEGLVRRWLDWPRRQDRGRFPTATKTNGQLWINWKQVYEWVHPYLDFGLSVVSTDALLPSAAEAESNMTDGMLTAKAKFSGLEVSHQGPLPVGAVVLPSLLAVAAAADESGGSDLARERLASQRLKVLYHHSTLFHKDLGRWPAEVAELDGYIDFAGNPELLKLNLSSRKQWADWLLGGFDADDDAAEDEEEEESEIDEDLYVIDWEPDRWTLGLAPGTLEHLERLYIDHDGVVHRVEKKPETGASGEDRGDSAQTEPATP